MATLLFVDTNIWLDFYRLNNEAGLSLLHQLKQASEFIIVTEQVQMEFHKNRQAEILRSVSALSSPNTMPFPAFLAGAEIDKFKKTIQDAQRLFKAIQSQLPSILKAPEENDPVYQTCNDIFSKNDGLCFGESHPEWKSIQVAAENRHRLGYPPKKSSGTSIGDAVNWEWIIHSAKSSKSNIAIVSRDGDYGQTSGGMTYLNDHLKQEFSNRVGKNRKITLYSKVSSVLKEYRVIVTKKAQQEEDRIIQLSPRPIQGSGFANFLSSQTAAIFNSANTPQELAAWAAFQAAMQNRRQQAAISGLQPQREEEQKS